MNTKQDFDYREFMKRGEVGPLLHRGPEARSKRREAAKTRITIRIDAEIIDQFKNLVPDGHGYQSLINLALREWLAARGVEELLQEKINEVIDQALASIKSAVKCDDHP